jgi:Bacterial Ig-like domain
VNADIKLTFNEKMDTASVTLTSDPNSDLGEPSWNTDANTLNFNPPTKLEISNVYTLSISRKDVAGNALAATMPKVLRIGQVMALATLAQMCFRVFG